MHIKRLPLDTLITGIGHLFRYNDKPWFINLWGESEDSKAKSLYTTNFTEPLSYQGSAFLKLPKFP
ncbi:hypothetical protein, partial [Acinetobacter baumannii]|uniref:hypothetical protein n=1 Tax=Acinetobacter baumannii TaxID=470 RepID=UPI0027378A86